MRLAPSPLNGKKILCMLKGTTFKQFGKPKLKWNNVDKHVKSKERKANSLSHKIATKMVKLTLGDCVGIRNLYFGFTLLV